MTQASPPFPPTELLVHMLEACDHIERYCLGLDEAGFIADDLRHNAALRMLEVLGEAAQRLLRRYPAFAVEHPELPLTSAYQLRNAITHGYDKVDLPVIWQTIKNDLPPLRRRLQDLLAE